MYRIIIFAGTTEGRNIAEFLGESRINTLVSVATGYGRSMIEEDEYISVTTGRLEESEIEELLRKETPELVIDATHPYAAEVTANIKAAAEASGTEYVRVLRQGIADEGESVVHVGSAAEAAEYLDEREGRVLLTTGSKEISEFAGIRNGSDRLVVRVLPSEESIKRCISAGIEARNIICMNGPFIRETNEAILKQYGCSYLVTKLTGNAGGYFEKIDAARNCGATSVVIGAPPQEEGISYYRCISLLCSRFEIKTDQYVALVGIGMGTEETMTAEAYQAIREAELVVGAPRMLASVNLSGKAQLNEYNSDKICDYITSHPEYRKVAVLLSGDVGFYSGARSLAPKLAGAGCKVFRIAGISSVAYFMSRIQMNWEDAVIVSNHGRQTSLVPLVRDNEKVFSLLGGKDDVSELAGKLKNYGLGHVKMFVGERLSYPDWSIMSGRAEEFLLDETDALAVVCIVNKKYRETRINTASIRSDEEFIRGDVPMTKEAIRTISISKLGINDDSVCYDIGAGTGSVSVEMALRARHGKVYAIEKKEEAVSLIRENRRKFKTDNVEIIKGEAPEAMSDLPAPTHVFIGGTSGRMEEVIEAALEKNPDARVVINCIALESASKALSYAKDRGIEADVLQVQVSKGQKLAGLTMMKGENPITIIAF